MKNINCPICGGNDGECKYKTIDDPHFSLTITDKYDILTPTKDF